MVIRIAILSAFLLMVSVGQGGCLSGNEVVQLTEAGVSEATIQVIIREKIVETRAFTVQEIIDMKASGIEDDTLRLLLEEASFLKGEKTVVYGGNTRPLTLATVQDLKALKDAGMSDDILRAIVIYCSGDSSDVERIRAQTYLKDMGIVIIP